MGKIKIQIDELEAEMSLEGWINFKSKIMGAMLKNQVSWEEGCAMRALIDHALTQASANRAREQLQDSRRT